MRALWLDYQRPPPGRGAPGFLLLAGSLLAAGLLLADYFAIVGTLDDVTRQMARLRRMVASQTTELVAPGAQAADRWESLFASLESAGDDSVTLLALKPGRNEIVISGEARDVDASMEYVKRLQSTAEFANIHLTQSEVVADHPQRPIRFSLASARQGAAP